MMEEIKKIIAEALVLTLIIALLLVSKKLMPLVNQLPQVDNNSLEINSEHLVLLQPDKEAKQEPTQVALLDINMASAEELCSLKGIGPVLAERIIQRRGTEPFLDTRQLLEIKGIGPSKLAQIEKSILIDRKTLLLFF